MIIKIDTERLKENIELLCGQHDSGMKKSILMAVERSREDEEIYSGLMVQLSNIEKKIKLLEEKVDEPEKTMMECYKNCEN